MDPQQLKLSVIVKSILNLQTKIFELSRDANIKVNIINTNKTGEIEDTTTESAISICMNENLMDLNYSSTLTEKLSQITSIEGLGAAFLINNPLLHDIKIKVHGIDRVFYCHKKYLMKYSKYFETMFSNSEYNESSQDIISMVLLYPEIFEAALYYFYIGELKNEQINEENYFQFCWLADYLICEEMKLALIKEFVWGYHSSKHFRASMFPIDMLEGWMKNVMTRQFIETERSTGRERKRNEMSLKWKRKWLQLCLIWADNSKSLQAVRQAVVLIKKYNLVDEKVLPHLSVYLGHCNQEMQQVLDPLGVFELTSGMQARIGSN